MAVTISLIPFVKLPEVFSSLMTSPALLGKVNRGWQESTTTEEEMQAVNRNINEQKTQTIETLRQTIKEWDIS